MATQGATQERTNIKLQEPKKYNVIMHNDDFTTMEFVVEVLVDIFHKSEAEAEALMMTVHKGGKAVIGCYPFDIVVSKVNAARMRAKAAGFPFKITVEEA
ncbi:MAG: ATP-dependent Clp protease adaptor ClpS [Lachnospiraceae bacterium]|jgi:ATP-dependent Clp protease adaptor protein ClpS|nr:ATP-dependent Clp protease adaptor ClpS [Lachnospiraceae bacterium]